MCGVVERMPEIRLQISDPHVLLTGRRILGSPFNPEASISSTIRIVTWPAEVYKRS